MENKQQGRLLGLRGGVFKLRWGMGRKMAPSLLLSLPPELFSQLPRFRESGTAVGAGLPSGSP